MGEPVAQSAGEALEAKTSSQPNPSFVIDEKLFDLAIARSYFATYSSRCRQTIVTALVSGCPAQIIG